MMALRIIELLAFLSILCIGYGIFLIYPPYAFIAVGILLFICCYLSYKVNAANIAKKVK